MDKSSRQKINKEAEDLNNIINHLHLTDIYKTPYITTAKNTFFSSIHRTFSRIDNMLGHKISLNKQPQWNEAQNQ